MKRAVLASIFAFATSGAMAIEKNFYLKSAYGHVDPDVEELEEYLDIKLSDPKGYSITLGYRINRFLAVEGGYTDLGEAEGEYQDSYSDSYTYSNGWREDDTYSEKITGSLGATSKMLGMLVSTDMNEKFTAGLRLGIQRWEAEVKATRLSTIGYELYDDRGILIDFGALGDPISESATDDGSDAYYGVTVGWAERNWVLSLEHTIFEMEDQKPSLSAIALSYNF